MTLSPHGQCCFQLAARLTLGLSLLAGFGRAETESSEALLFRRLPPVQAAEVAATIAHAVDASQRSADVKLPAGVRNQLLQAALLETTLLPGGSGDNVGSLIVNSEISLGLPGPFPNSMILISPGFEVNWLRGPVSLDLPGQLFRASTRFQLRGLATAKLGYELSVSPGVFSDFETGSDDAFRTPGHIGMRYQFDERRYLYVGFLYLDREDVAYLPMGGMVWKPHDGLKVEALFPRPRIAWKTGAFGHWTPGRDHWIYFASDFGGGSWAIQRADGIDDTVTLRDFRLVFGYEGLVEEGVDFRSEIGIVVGRSIELLNSGQEIEPSATMLLRLGLIY